MKTDSELLKEDRLRTDGTCIMLPHGKLKLKGFTTVIWTRNEPGINDLVPMYNHVSFCCKHSPTYKEMKTIKEIFFHDEDEVIQFFPRASEYINIKDDCYHLWEPILPSKATKS